MKTVSCILFFLCTGIFIAQTTYNIDDPEDLRTVIYQPGDVIILKDGTYDTDERLRFLGSGTADNPVVFRAETPGGVTFTGGARLTIGGKTDSNGTKIATGEYLVVDGFYWKVGYGASNFIEFRNGTDYAHHSTIQNCAIDGLGIAPSELAEDLADEQIPKHRWVVLYGTYNKVINCTFMNKVSAGVIILAEYSYNAFPEVPDGAPEINNSCTEVGHVISNNYFYNFSKINELYGKKANGDDLSNAGDSETIRLGASAYQMVNSNVTVSHNYFVQSDGENEIITNKSKNNNFINNTFRRCRGSLVLRHGSNATVNANYFLGENVEGTGGIRISDSNHTITNNYIQDCVTTQNQAKWNNGITFIGGGDTAAVACTNSNVTNGYQKAENITLSNNTLVNTNAPLFYNGDKGTTSVTGTVSNNLIYFDANNANVSTVISGDNSTSYNAFGTALTYSDNVFKGASLGVTNSGFSEQSNIVATQNNDIFNFSGAPNKGADLGTYEPTTDAMVGYGIGACFLNSVGTKILNGNCTIVVADTLTISTLNTLPANAASYDVTVTANVGWSAITNNSWLSINTSSGSGSAVVSVSVLKNETTDTRVGTITFTQVAGGDDIEKTVTITQDGLSVTDLYALINTGDANDPVTIHSFSKEEVGGTKTNAAINTLDKNNNTVWAADDGPILPGAYKGDGEYIIYDLGSNYNLKLIQFTTTNKSDAFGFQVWISNTDTATASFTKVLPTTEELLLTAINTTAFNSYELSAAARYVKLIGFGRFNATTDSRESVWSAVGEIEFFEASSLSTTKERQLDAIKIYPNPVSTQLHFKNATTNLKSITIYNMLGQKIVHQNIIHPNTNISLNVAQLKNGVYIVAFNNDTQTSTKLITIAH